MCTAESPSGGDRYNDNDNDGDNDDDNDNHNVDDEMFWLCGRKSAFEAIFNEIHKDQNVKSYGGDFKRPSSSTQNICEYDDYRKKTDDDFESILLDEILVDIVNETTAGFPAVHHPRQAEPLLLFLFLFLLLLLLS